jgi:sulfide dehydrogenase cytochrome subunit
MLARILIAFTLATAACSASADVTTLVKDCEGCHGNNGVSTANDVPTIAGMSAGVHGDYLISYKNKERPCPKSKYRNGDTKRPETDMCTVAGKLSDADMDALAKYFSAKPFAAAKQPFDAAKAAAGKALHMRACEKCHTGGGRDADADASILAGQQGAYLKKSIEEFMAGTRPQPKKMKEKFAGLKAADIDALLYYYASQQ